MELFWSERTFRENHRVIKLFWLEQTPKVIESNHQTNTILPKNRVLKCHIHTWTSPGMVTQCLTILSDQVQPLSNSTHGNVEHIHESSVTAGSKRGKQLSLEDIGYQLPSCRAKEKGKVVCFFPLLSGVGFIFNFHTFCFFSLQIQGLHLLNWQLRSSDNCLIHGMDQTCWEDYKLRTRGKQHGKWSFFNTLSCLPSLDKLEAPLSLIHKEDNQEQNSSVSSFPWARLLSPLLQYFLGRTTQFQASFCPVQQSAINITSSWSLMSFSLSMSHTLL